MMGNKKNEPKNHQNALNNHNKEFAVCLCPVCFILLHLLCHLLCCCCCCGRFASPDCCDLPVFVSGLIRDWE